MSRSKWKFKYTKPLKKTIKSKVWDRDQILLNKLLNKTVLVYNGLQFVKVKIESFKLGYKYGEFAYTRKHVKKESFDRQIKK